MNAGRPEVVRVPATERAAPGPCVVCNKPIAPGQIYAVDGPKHITCGVERRHPRAFGMWWRA